MTTTHRQRQRIKQLDRMEEMMNPPLRLELCGSTAQTFH